MESDYYLYGIAIIIVGLILYIFLKKKNDHFASDNLNTADGFFLKDVVQSLQIGLYDENQFSYKIMFTDAWKPKGLLIQNTYAQNIFKGHGSIIFNNVNPEDQPYRIVFYQNSKDTVQIYLEDKQDKNNPPRTIGVAKGNPNAVYVMEFKQNYKWENGIKSVYTTMRFLPLPEKDIKGSSFVNLNSFKTVGVNYIPKDLKSIFRSYYF